MSDPTAIEVNLDPFAQRMSGMAIHGNTPFDVSIISHIEGNLYMGGCVNGLILPEYIQHVISLYPWEQYSVRHEIKSYLMVWAYDSEPKEVLSDGLVEWAVSRVQDAPTLIHCQAGLNRSALISAMVLVTMGKEPWAAIELLREKRSPAVLCNKSFERHIYSTKVVGL